MTDGVTGRTGVVPAGKVSRETVVLSADHHISIVSLMATDVPMKLKEATAWPGSDTLFRAGIKYRVLLSG
jgi:hypothetical protein